MTCLQLMCDFFMGGWICDMPHTEHILSISCDFTEVMGLIREKPATLHHIQTKQSALSLQAVSKCSGYCQLLWLVEITIIFTAFSCYCKLWEEKRKDIKHSVLALLHNKYRSVLICTHYENKLSCSDSWDLAFFRKKKKLQLKCKAGSSCRLSAILAHNKKRLL